MIPAPLPLNALGAGPPAAAPLAAAPTPAFAIFPLPPVRSRSALVSMIQRTGRI